MKLKFRKVNSKAILPSRGSEFAAGLDLFSIERTLIGRGEVMGLRTGLAVEIPKGYYGRIAPRSGLALVKSIDVFGGVIDSDFRGEVICILANLGKTDFLIEEGDRIAQLIIEKITLPTPIWTDLLDQTRRNRGGFGSTGS